jgi:hypothetical protein
MAWSDAARAAAAEVRRMHARYGEGLYGASSRKAMATAIRGERNKNTMNSAMVSVHDSYGKAIAARNSNARQRAIAMFRADRKFGIK